jgi:predicted MFS family arabinose efflux permease
LPITSTDRSVLSLFQNLFGLAAGPFIAGVLSDAWGLETALAVMPAFGALAAMLLLLASRSYVADIAGARAAPADTAAGPSPRPAIA